ncbi:MAG: YjgP/YjgQ family permease [Deltaproteobacteria bacterium]|nr:YjgP/YjgQ family permease [Deltaproteobacteria bacterium]
MTLFRYILGRVAGAIAASVIVLAILVAIINFFDTAGIVMKGRGDFYQAIMFYVLQMPKQVHVILPMAVMFGVILGLGTMAKSGELIAAMSLGAGKFRLMAPVLLCGVAAAMIDVVLSEALVPPADKEADRLRVEVFKAFTWSWTKYYGGRRWLKGPFLFAHVEQSSSSGKRLLKPVVFEYGKDFRLKRRIRADRLVFENSKWAGRNVEMIDFGPGQEIKRKFEKSIVLDLGVGPGDLETIRGRPYQLHLAELEKYIEDAKKQGRTAREYVMEIESRFSFPLMMIVGVLLGFWASSGSGRQGGLVNAVARGVAAAFLAWMMLAFSSKLAVTGAVGPLAGAWIPVVLLLAASLYMAMKTDFSSS